MAKQHMVPEKRITRFDRERDARASGLAEQIEPASALVAPGQLQTNLAMKRDPDVTLPGGGELLEPFGVVSENVVLEIDHRKRPTLENVTCLGDDSIDRAHGELEPAVHIVERRRVTISAEERATHGSHDALDGARAELRIRVVDDVAIGKREAFDTPIDAEMHPARERTVEQLRE